MVDFLRERLNALLSFSGTLSVEILSVTLVAALCIWTCRWARRSKKVSGLKASSDASNAKIPVITPLRGFNWKTTEPIQFRPFVGKEKYNMTMALENLDPSELIPMDKTYKDRLAVRKALLKNHHDIVVAVNETAPPDTRIRAAVSELYTFVLRTYLPTRYPTMFKLHSNAWEEPFFENLVTAEKWPATLAADTPTIRALEILAQIVDEEFLILLPDLSLRADQPKYRLQAYATCFPSGFNTREKLGLRLADIHGPVPGYADKLERSMDRFFARIEVGRCVKRVNWSLTTETELFAAFASEENNSRDFNIDQTRLRCERQTLHRLSLSKALVFSFHTYTYPIRQIKDEGLGEELALAIDGLRNGNVPGIYSYKKGYVWGEVAKEFLRS